MGYRLRPIFFCNKTAARLAKAILTYFINEFYCTKNLVYVLRYCQYLFQIVPELLGVIFSGGVRL